MTSLLHNEHVRAVTAEHLRAAEARRQLPPREQPARPRAIRRIATRVLRPQLRAS